MRTNRMIAAVILLIPSMTFANPIKEFRNSYEGFKYSQERLDKYVMACLASFDTHDRNYHHEELEQMALDCANRLIEKVDEYNYGKQTKGDPNGNH